MGWTKEKMLHQLATSNKSVCHALLRLYARQTAAEQEGIHTGEINGMGFTSVDAEFLSSLALSVAWRIRQKETGQLQEDAPLLTPRQLACARKALQKYWGQLCEIANQRAPQKAENLRIHYRQERPAMPPVPKKPICSVCGQAAQSKINDVDYCGYCLHDELRRRDLEPYPMTDEERRRYREEEIARANPVRVETDALVIKGRDIRFKTARELARTKTGLSPAMEAELGRFFNEREHEPGEEIDDMESPFVWDEIV